jgi:hypothetical protein
MGGNGVYYSLVRRMNGFIIITRNTFLKNNPSHARCGALTKRSSRRLSLRANREEPRADSPCHFNSKATRCCRN